MENIQSNSNQPKTASLPTPQSGQSLIEGLKSAGVDVAREFVIVFDFDGTLVELAPHPDQVVFHPAVQKDLKDLSQKLRVAICSGRGIPDLQRIFKNIPELDLIGSHGAEWVVHPGRDPATVQSRNFSTAEWKEWRKTRLPELIQKVKEVGGEIEDKETSLTVHYRHSGQVFWTEQVQWLRDLCGGNIDLVSGLAAWNLVMKGVSKGAALSQYVKDFSYRKLVYFGDEPTDETVFVREDIPLIGVHVGLRKTAAQFQLDSVAELHRWLSETAEYCRTDCYF